jgi:hypothetical protein
MCRPQFVQLAALADDPRGREVLDAQVLECRHAVDGAIRIQLTHGRAHMPDNGCDVSDRTDHEARRRVSAARWRIPNAALEAFQGIQSEQHLIVTTSERRRGDHVIS